MSGKSPNQVKNNMYYVALLFIFIVSGCANKQEPFYLTEWALQSDGGYTRNHKIIIKNKKDMDYWENSVNLGQIGPITGPYVQVSEFEIKLLDK